jgi:molecular chaperone Hsp33
MTEPSLDSPSGDYTRRTITDDGAFRAIVIRSSETVREICRRQKATGSTAKTLSDLVTATILFRETMSPALRVQGIFRKAQHRDTLVADSSPGGLTRGLVQVPSGLELTAETGDYLQMMRTLNNGSVNQGIVQVPEKGSITTAMMAYMRESEQVDTMLAVATRLEGGEVQEAGGYLVQLLPEVGKGPLAVMAARLEDFQDISHLMVPGFSPDVLLEELLYLMPHTPLDVSPVKFECWCSESRLLGALATIDRGEIRSMIEEGKPLEIDCDYCGKEYRIQPSSLLGLLQES